MRISRTRKLTLDLGHYEKLEFSVTVTMGHEDLGLTDEEAREECAKKGGRQQLEQDLIKTVMTCLNGQLGPEIEEAAELTAAEKSVLTRIMRDYEDGVSTRTANRARRRS